MAHISYKGRLVAAINGVKIFHGNEGNSGELENLRKLRPLSSNCGILCSTMVDDE